MSLKFTLIRSSELQTAQWAGGTTTQLSIFPANATYKAFDFDYRISFATVETPTSTFTFMPGVTRHLMVMKGTLDLTHTGRHEQHLEPFVPYTFDGEWPTTAVGKVTDFNLMTRGEFTGQAGALILENNNLKVTLDQQFYLPDNFACAGFYLFEGSAIIRTAAAGNSFELQAGDFILVEPDGKAHQLILTTHDKMAKFATAVVLKH